MPDDSPGPLPRSLRIIEGGKKPVIERKGGFPPNPPTLVADGLMHPTAITMCFGKGGVGKGLIAVYAFAALQREGHTPLILDFEQHPWEWQSRMAWAGIKEYLYLEPDGPLTREMALDIGYEIAVNGVTHLLLDSVSMARQAHRDGDMGGADAANALFRNIEKMGRPCFVLAHEPKSNPNSPIGSTQYLTVPRLAWHVTQPSVFTVELRMVKASDRPMKDKPLTFTQVIEAVEGQPGNTSIYLARDTEVKPKVVPEKESIAAAMLRLFKDVDRNMDAEETQRYLTDLGYTVSITSLRAMLSRAVSKGQLQRPRPGYYCWPVDQIDIT